MRIGPGIVLPPAPTLPANALAALATPDRATLYRVAAMAAAAPEIALATPSNAAASTPTMPPLPAGAPPLPNPPTDHAGAALVSLIRALPDLSSPTRLLAGGASIGPAPLAAAAMQSATLASALAVDPSVNLTAARPLIEDRLSLSPAAASLKPVVAAAPRTPVGQFVLDLLESLTGEPDRALQFLEPGLRNPIGVDYLALALKNPDALLRLLIQGKVQTDDDQQLDLSFHLTVEQPDSAALPDVASRVAIRAALDQLAQMKRTFDYPGPAAHLAGQSAQFEAALDPRTPWAMPGFFLSGLLLLGQAREVERLDEMDELDDSPEESPHEDPQDAAAEQLPSPPRRKRKPKREANALTPLPADGGLPIIPARLWLELELRHIQRQLRLWMMLPALP